MSIKEIEFAIKNFPLKKTPASDNSIVFKTFEEEVVPMSHKLFQKIENERMFPNTLYVIRITLITKSDKNTIRKIMD